MFFKNTDQDILIATPHILHLPSHLLFSKQEIEIDLIKI